MNALATLGYQFRDSDRITYTLFYTRNASDTYMHREGYNLDYEGLLGSSSVTHIYSLLNNQLLGTHKLGDRFTLDWAGAYGTTRSDEPDRRDMLFTRKDDGSLKLFTSNGNAVFRYFGELEENEVIGDLRLTYDLKENHKLSIGGTYRDKKRDFYSTRFYYNYQGYNPIIPDEYDTDIYFNHNNIVNGDVTVSHDAQPRNSYDADHQIVAAFADLDYSPIPQLNINLGLRFEHSEEYVHYWNDGGSEKSRNYVSDDLFPALNLKYVIAGQNNLRLSASRTVTRPSFIEMAPFLYQESLGSDAIRGNANLMNGYNYNIDLRYEWFSKNNQDMFSTTLYYKRLDSPIERVQQTSGGAAVHTFQNTDEGQAAGLEFEVRKSILPNLKAGANVSLMYTNITLPEGGGNYTESSRGLQGASPYLGNADITYTSMINEEKQHRLNLSLLYNLQGPRIYSVGIEGAGDIKQQPLHTLDFAGSIDINGHLSIKAQVKDILNTTYRFNQEIKSTGEIVEVRSFKTGTKVELSAAYKF